MLAVRLADGGDQTPGEEHEQNAGKGVDQDGVHDVQQHVVEVVAHLKKG